MATSDMVPHTQHSTYRERRSTDTHTHAPPLSVRSISLIYTASSLTALSHYSASNRQTNRQYNAIQFAYKRERERYREYTHTCNGDTNNKRNATKQMECVLFVMLFFVVVVVFRFGWVSHCFQSRQPNEKTKTNSIQRWMDEGRKIV